MRKPFHHRVLSVFLMSLASSMASIASVAVPINSSTFGPYNVSGHLEPNKDGRYEITIVLGEHLAQHHYNVQVHATDPDVDVEFIRFVILNNTVAPDNTVVDVSLRGAPGQSANFRNVLLIEQVVANGANVRPAPLYLNILDITGDLGDVAIHGSLGETLASVGGDVIGTVQVELVDDVEETGVIHSLTIEGDLLGDVTAVEVVALGVGGNIGAPLNPQDIQVFGDVGDILVDGAIFASVDIGGDLGRLQTRGFGAQGGSFEGSLIVDAIANISPFAAAGIFIHDSLNGSIELADALGFPIHIGDSLIEYSVIDLPSGGLSDQIIVNQRDVSGTWDGEVVVGSTTLADGYSATAASLGGGAAGMAPFTHHGTSCAPQHGSTIYIRYLDLGSTNLCEDEPFTSATVRLYGPMTLVGVAPHFEVLKWNGSSYVDAGFTVQDDYAAGSGFRAATIEIDEYPEGWPAGEYRIKPIAGKVTCRDVAGASGAPDVADFSYDFALVEDCAEMLMGTFDLNEDSALCGQDIAAWTAAPVDFDGSGVADVADLSYLYNAVSLYGDN